MKSIVESPWEFACQWYGADEIHKSITRSPLLRSIGDMPPVPEDVYSPEFAEFLTEQYRLAMRKGAELAIAEMNQSSQSARNRAIHAVEIFEDALRHLQLAIAGEWVSWENEHGNTVHDTVAQFVNHVMEKVRNAK